MASPASIEDHDPRSLAEVLADHGEFKEAVKLDRCGHYHFVGECGCSGHKYHRKVYRCHSRWCDYCAKVEKGRVFNKYKQMLIDIASNLKKGWGFKHLTLTIPAGAYDSGTIKKLFGTLKELKRYRYVVLSNGVEIKKELFVKGSGMIAVFECGHGKKYNRGGAEYEGTRLNPHLHVLIYSPRFISYHVLHQAWRSLWTKARILECTQLKIRDGKRVLGYILKYLTKPYPLMQDENAFIMLHQSLKGRRKLHTFGCFYGKTGPDHRPVESCDACGREIIYCFKRTYQNDDSMSPWVAQGPICLGRDPPGLALVPGG